MEKLLTLGLVNAVSATVLAIVVVGLGRFLARRPAALHCLWLLVLLKLVTPPLFAVPILDRISGLASSETLGARLENTTELVLPANQVAITSEAVSDELFTALLEVSRDGNLEQGPSGSSWWSALIPWLAAVWLAGTAATLVLAAVRVHRFHGLLRQADAAPDAVQERTAALAQRLGVKRPPQAFWIDAKLMPMLWAAACRPRLIIPRELWKSLGERQQSLVLAHELAHLRRGDHVIRLLELCVTALYWWLPVVWWARSALRNAEEECCDAWVVWAFPDEARTYAETLLDTVDFLNPAHKAEPLLASGFGRAHHLRRRLTMIMLGTKSPRLGWASALGTLGLSAVLLPMTPSWAQKPQESVETTAVVYEIKDDHGAKPADVMTSTSELVNVVVTTDGQAEQVQADSLDKAVELIKQRIETLVKENGKPDSQAAQLRALKQAVVELEKARAKNLGHGKLVVRVESQDASPKVKAEKKAQIDQARFRIETLRKELKDKQQQLASAQHDLEKLVGLARSEYRVTTQPYISKLDKLPVQMLVRAVPEFAGGPIIVGQLPKVPPELKSSSNLTPSDKERLESLEKKLTRLLDEVASLKKHEEKPK